MVDLWKGEKTRVFCLHKAVVKLEVKIVDTSAIE